MKHKDFLFETVLSRILELALFAKKGNMYGSKSCKQGAAGHIPRLESF
jgi:hypothetical protein